MKSNPILFNEGQKYRLDEIPPGSPSRNQKNSLDNTFIKDLLLKQENNTSTNIPNKKVKEKTKEWTKKTSQEDDVFDMELE